MMAAWAEDGDAPVGDDTSPAGQGSTWVASGEGLLAKGLSGLRAHPKVDDVLFAHVLGLGPAVTRDGGATWTQLENGIKTAVGPRSIVRIALDQRELDTMYVVIDGHIYRSEDGGGSFIELTSGALATNTWDRTASAHQAFEVVVDPKKSVQLLVGTYNDGRHHGGLFESSDGGRSWEQIAGSNLDGTGLGSDTFWVRRDPKTEKNVIVAGRTGVWYSDDRGRTFARNDPGEEGARDVRHLSEFVGVARDLLLTDARGVWRSKDGGKKWGKDPILAGDCLFAQPDPHEKRRVLAIARDRGLLDGDDSGREWRPIGGSWGATAENPGDPASGYHTALPAEVLMHPRDRKRIYLASPATGLHVSEDDGASFKSIEMTNAPGVVTPIAVCGVGPGGVHLAVSEYGRVFRSSDEGATFEAVGVVGTAPHLLRAGATQGEWWLAGGRLLRSTDGGATWANVYAPANLEEQIADCRISKEGEIRLLLARAGAVATSLDGGVTWAHSPEPRLPAATWAVSLAVDPASRDHWLVALRSLQLPWTVGDTNGGLLETWDAGKAWKRADDGLRPTKGEKPEVVSTRRGWNQGRLAVVDPVSGLIFYGCETLGLFGRVSASPTGPKPETPPRWIAIGPQDPKGDLKGFEMSAWAYQASPDGSASRFALQLYNPTDGRNRVFTATGESLRSLFDAKQPTAKEEEDASAGAWFELPGAPTAFSCLTFDPDVPGRLFAGDQLRANGCISLTPAGAPSRGEAAGPVEPPDDPAPGEPIASEPKEPPPGTLQAISVSADGSARVWGLAGRAQAQVLSGHQGAITGVALLPGGGVVTAGKDRCVRRWTGEPLASADPLDTGSQINALCVGPEWIFAATEEGQSIVAISLGTAAQRNFVGHTGGVRALAQSADANRLYSGGADQTVRVWDVAAGIEVLSIPVGGVVRALAVDAAGGRIYVAVDGFGLKAFNAAGEPAGNLEMGTGQVNALCLAPDGTVLYAASTGVVGVIDATTLSPRGLHTGPQGAVQGVATSPDGNWVVAGDDNNSLWLWHRGEDAARWHHPTAHTAPVLGLAVRDQAGAGAVKEPEPAPAKEGGASEAGPKDGAGVEPPPGGGAGGVSPDGPPAPGSGG